jgi:hypothetical protein
MPGRGPRTRQCSAADARIRLQQAEAFVLVAELALTDETDTATPGVAAALAVLAGVAASDSACCARFGRRPRGQDHAEAIELLKGVAPHGPKMAKALRDLLAAKDESHYGLTLVSRTKARVMLRRAASLVDDARSILER